MLSKLRYIRWGWDMKTSIQKISIKNIASFISTRFITYLKPIYPIETLHGGKRNV